MSETTRKLWKVIVLNGLIIMGLFAVASTVGYVFYHLSFQETNIVMMYLLAVLFTTWFTRSFALGLTASVISTFAYNYFFAEPHFTFSVSDPAYLTTFITMTITALVTSSLTSHVQRSARRARQKEAETAAFYSLTNHLTDAKNVYDIAAISVQTISHYFSCQAACLCFDEEGYPEKTFIQQTEGKEQVRRNVLNPEDIQCRMSDLRTAFAEGEEFFDWPIYGSENILGLIRIPSEVGKIMDEAQRRILQSMIESTALAMDRFRSVEQHSRAREETARERYRATLLRAISHDLRTPLTGIIGLSEMMIGMTEEDDLRREIARDIYRDAEWLHSLTENILSLTRLQDGNQALQKQLEPIEEVVSGAVAHFSKNADRKIHTDIPTDLLLVPMDARLIQQVLLNLLDNAQKHTPIEKNIGISVAMDNTQPFAVFTVWDEGNGIREDDLRHIFKMFYTSKAQHADSRSGIGLGLAICETIVSAHGGVIQAQNRPGKAGSEFVFRLPLTQEAEIDA